MGANDAAEQLEVAREQYGILEREVAELRKALAACKELQASADAWMSRAVATVAAERDALAAQIEQVRTAAKAWDDDEGAAPLARDIAIILATTPADALAKHDAEVAATALEEAVGYIAHDERLDLTNQSHSISVLKHRAAEYRTWAGHGTPEPTTTKEGDL